MLITLATVRMMVMITMVMVIMVIVITVIIKMVINLMVMVTALEKVLGEEFFTITAVDPVTISSTAGGEKLFYPMNININLYLSLIDPVTISSTAGGTKN